MIRFIIRYAIIFFLLSLLLQSCAFGKQFATTSADPADLKGTYTLLLYGCHYPADARNIAILIEERSKYSLEIHDLPTSFQEKGGVPGPQALKEADSFVRCSVHRVSETVLRRITDDAGGTIGFEVRPLYHWLEFGITDVLLVSYALQKNGTVRTYVRLDPEVDKMLESPVPTIDFLPRF